MSKLSTRISLLKSNSLKSEFKVIRSFFYNNALAYVLLYVQNVLINHFMPLDALGQFSYAQSMLLLFTSAFSMEVYSAYLRFFGCNNEKDLMHLVRRIMFVASALFCIVVLVYFRYPLYILFVGCMWMRERLYFFRAKLEINTYGRIKIIQYAISVSIIVALVAVGWLNEKSLLTGIGISYLAVSIVYSCNKKAKKCTVNHDDLPLVDAKDVFKYAIPLSFNAVVVWLLGAADQMVIDLYLNATMLTYYSVAFRIISVIRIGVSVIMEYWPRFYFERMESRDYAPIKTMRVFFVGVVIGLCVLCIVLSGPIYWLMGASQYSDTRWMFCFLAAAEMFRLCGSIYITFQSYMKNTLINVVCLAVLGSVKLLVNWLMIEQFGVSILFYTTLGCYVLYFVCSLYFGMKKEKEYMSKNPVSCEEMAR